MQRIYYQIDEARAKTAHNMMSMHDYREGSKTREYKTLVDKIYDLADKVADEKPKEAERVYNLAARYSKKMAEYMNKDISIGLMCPSVMISGAGNFPVKKKEKQVAAWDKNHEFYLEIQKIPEKIKNILSGKAVIKSGDEDAIERLEEKLESLRELQEEMKRANKAIRLKDISKGDQALKQMGYSEEQIVELRKPDFCGRIGFPDYALQNNNANIHRVEKRLNALKNAKSQGSVEKKAAFFKIVENTEIMRLQLFFDEKPESNVRDVLKSNGFRWSPKNSCWQRQLNNNGKAALSRILKRLEEE